MNQALIAALDRAAHILNMTPETVLETILTDFVERMTECPSEYLCEFSTCFVHDSEESDSTAAQRLSEFVAVEAEGQTVVCEIVRREAGGFVVSFNGVANVLI